MKKIIDVSKWNAITNYLSVSESIDGVVIRAGFRGYNEGVLAMDPRFLPYIKGLYEKEVPVGVYFFSTAITIAEAIEEANFVIDSVLSSMISLSFPIFINSEWGNSSHTGRSDNLSAEERTEIVLAFINQCHERGYNAGIYASEQWFKEKLICNRLEEYPKWVYKSSGIVFPNTVGVKNDNRGEVSGIAGKVDISNWSLQLSGESSVYSVPITMNNIIVDEPVVEEPKDETLNIETEDSKPVTIKEKKAVTKKKETAKKKYENGEAIRLVKNTPLYKTSITSTEIDVVGGKLYVAGTRVMNGRIKVTDEKEGQAIGWVDIKNIK